MHGAWPVLPLAFLLALTLGACGKRGDLRLLTEEERALLQDVTGPDEAPPNEDILAP